MTFANVGTPDRLIRLVLAALLAALPFVTAVEPASPLGVAAFVASTILAVTALVRFCPAYGLLRVSTARKR